MDIFAFATRGFSFATRQNNLVVSVLSCSQNKTEDCHVESNLISYCSQHVVVLNLSYFFFFIRILRLSSFVQCVTEVVQWCPKTKRVSSK